jgi:hypothetical protein
LRTKENKSALSPEPACQAPTGSPFVLLNVHICLFVVICNIAAAEAGIEIGYLRHN